MKKVFLLLLINCVGLSPIFVPGAGNNGKFQDVLLYFIANKGQVNGTAKFYARASGYTLWLTKEGLVFDSIGSRESESGVQKKTRDVSRLVFLNSRKSPEMAAEEVAKLKVNYFIGSDPSRWHGDVPTSAAVRYKGLYKNIDLKVYGVEKRVEYDWIVKPGGNPEDIRFRYNNVKSTRLDEEGSLVIETEFGQWVHQMPRGYQVIGPGNEGQALVNVKFKKISTDTYGFGVGKYDRGRELIIDPVILAYSTYLGGGYWDHATDIAVDSSGCAYVVGQTESTDFPTLNQFQTNQDNINVFVSKIDTTKNGAASLIYSTYLGGNGWNYGYGIAVDSSGCAYVTGGTSSTDFPTLNQYQKDPGDSYYDAFVTKLDTTQSGAASLIYSTYLGGGYEDLGCGIAVDDSGNAYVTGDTYSTDFPTLNQYQGDPGDAWYDAFVTKLDTTRSGAASLIYSTYLGGDGSDGGRGIAVDNGGCAYVIGNTGSTDFPTLNQYQKDPADSNGDAFVTKIDTACSGAASLIYSTYLGGSGEDYGSRIALDSSGSAYVTGETYSADFPTLNAFQGTYQGGDSDAFVTRVDTTRSGAASLIYSTYLGGDNRDSGNGIAVDNNGCAYVTGYTWSQNFPTLNQYQTDQYTSDAFVTQLDTTQSGASGLIYSTYLGGYGYDWDEGWGIAVDESGDVYVTGNTDSTDFPTLNQFQDYQENGDIFITKLTLSTITPPTVMTAAVSFVTPVSASGGGRVTDDGGAAVTARGVCWSEKANPTISDNHTTDGRGTGPFTSSITGLTPGTTYYVRAYARNSAGTGYGRLLTFKTLSNPSISGTITGSSGTGIPDVTLTFSGSGGTVLTGQGGTYSRTVPYNWSGTVTPSKTGHVFEPVNRVNDSVISDIGNQDYTAYYIVLSLRASRETERAWLIRRQYGKVDLTVENEGNLPVSKYVVYRKESGENFLPLIEISGSQFQGPTYSYVDKYLDKDKSYTYKFSAVDANGITIAGSNEKTI